MGIPKQKWTTEEEEALRKGILKHGAGKWKNIQKDPEFNPLLASRSNIDLKDKWRNLNVANGQNPREKSRTVKLKGDPDSPATPLLLTQAPASSAPLTNDAPADVVMDDSTKCMMDGKPTSKYNPMIFEALSALNDPNGSDISSIVGYIKDKHGVQPNFKRLLSGKLGRLVVQGRIEKAPNGYRIASQILPKVTALPAPKPTDIVDDPRLPQMSGSYPCENVADAAVAGAYRVAEAENKSFVAAEAIKEAERVAKMAEDTDSFKQLAEEILEICSCGNTLMMMIK